MYRVFGYVTLISVDRRFDMNPYSVLEVSAMADRQEIKKKYRELAKKYHPDSPNGDASKFDEIQKAWEMIENGAVGSFIKKGSYVHKSAFTVVKA